MVRRNAFRWTLATLALLGAGTASADPINFTGIAPNDFNKTDHPGVVVSHVDADPREVGLRCEVHKFQWIAAARLEVHGLPHSARFSVALLALELERVRRVVHADH